MAKQKASKSKAKPPAEKKPPALPFPLSKPSETLPKLLTIFKYDVDSTLEAQLRTGMKALHEHYSTKTDATDTQTSRRIAAGLAMLIEMINAFPEPFTSPACMAWKEKRRKQVKEGKYYAFGRVNRPCPAPKPVGFQVQVATKTTKRHKDEQAEFRFFKSGGVKPRISMTLEETFAGTGLVRFTAVPKKDKDTDVHPIHPMFRTDRLPLAMASKEKEKKKKGEKDLPFTLTLTPVATAKPLLKGPTMATNWNGFFSVEEDASAERAFFQIIVREEWKGNEIEMAAMLGVGMMVVFMRDVTGGFGVVMKRLVEGEGGGVLGQMREGFERDARVWECMEKDGWDVIE